MDDVCETPDVVNVIEYQLVVSRPPTPRPIPIRPKKMPSIRATVSPAMVRMKPLL